MSRCAICTRTIGHAFPDSLRNPDGVWVSHTTCTSCAPTGVRARAVVPCREPQDIREGDVVRVAGTPFWRGKVGKVHCPLPSYPGSFAVGGLAFSGLVLRRLA